VHAKFEGRGVTQASRIGTNVCLLVLTASYPFSVAAERTFLEPEIRRYRDRFARIVLVPQDIRGDRVPIAEGVEVDTSLAEGLQAMRRLPLLVRGLLSRYLYRELRRHPWLLTSPITVLRMAVTWGRVEWMVGWLKHRCSAPGAETPMVAYAFWLDTAILAAGVYRLRGGQLGVVARAHGGDLYAERHSPPHIPFQQAMVELADHIAPDSAAGTDYLRSKYPQHAHKIAAALLGTDDPGFRTAASPDGVVRIVSCAFLVSVKRIDLLVRGIAALAARNEGLFIEWTHFGDGPLMPDIRSLAVSLLPDRVRWELKGHVETRAIYAWYREHPVDAFVNVSSSEGTPVSIMEAISCSIPVIATRVGGNQEITNDSLGQLISPNPTAQEIAAAFENVCLQPHRREALKSASRAQWEAHYNAEANYSAFGRLLQNSHQTTPITIPHRR
jgi:colanic acid/amylovoran biosynthesis glycosyltransferase